MPGIGARCVCPHAALTRRCKNRGRGVIAFGPLSMVKNREKARHRNAQKSPPGFLWLLCKSRHFRLLLFCVTQTLDFVSIDSEINRSFLRTLWARLRKAILLLILFWRCHYSARLLVAAITVIWSPPRLYTPQRFEARLRLAPPKPQLKICSFHRLLARKVPPFGFSFSSCRS